MWAIFADFMAFFDPTVTWRGKSYRFDVDVIRAAPLVCGTNLRDAADLVLDNCMHHWLPFYRSWTHTAVNSGVQFLNNGLTFRSLHKHNAYDLLSRAMHPRDRHPKTVMLPEYYPYTADQEKQMWWENEQKMTVESTSLGFDPERSVVDQRQLKLKVHAFRRLQGRLRQMRVTHYPAGNYLKEVVEQHFGGKFPLYLKPMMGFDGTDVSRINNLEELYQAYDRTRGEGFHLQEGIDDYDVFVRCMSVGPQVLTMRFLRDEPIHLHYSAERFELEPDMAGRLRNYVRFINSYHRWNHNAFEALVKDGAIHPIDYANTCPDSSLMSLHVHFPWLICALVRWCTFVVVAEVDLRSDMEQKMYAEFLNDSTKSAEEKYEACRQLSHAYFRTEEFAEYCASGLQGLEEAMARYYDANAERMVDRLLRTSTFQPHEIEHFVRQYLEKMNTCFRPNASQYLTAGVPC